jgi:hypothetical protein
MTCGGVCTTSPVAFLSIRTHACPSDERTTMRSRSCSSKSFRVEASCIVNATSAGTDNAFTAARIFTYSSIALAGAGCAEPTPATAHSPRTFDRVSVCSR